MYKSPFQLKRCKILYRTSASVSHIVSSDGGAFERESLGLPPVRGKLLEEDANQNHAHKIVAVEIDSTLGIPRHAAVDTQPPKSRSDYDKRPEIRRLHRQL